MANIDQGGPQGAPQYITQATNLPPKEEMITTLQPVMTLTGRANYEEWAYVVHSRLDLHGLDDIVSDLPRPPPADPKYNQWRMASKAVQNWLITIIDPNILRSLRVHGSSTRFGDECWRAINQIVNGQGLTESRRVWLRTVQMKRSEFGSLEHYINTLRQNLIICQRVEMTITWYQAALLLLDQTAEELPNWTTVSELDLSRQAPSEYSQNMFFQLCADAIERSRKEPQFLAAQASKRFPDNKNEDNRNKQPKNSPPAGRDHAEWATQMKSKAPAKNGNRCGYCNFAGHDRMSCFYLRPDLRPSTWKPKSNLWCFLPTQHAMAIQAPSQSDDNNDEPAFDFNGMAITSSPARVKKGTSQSKPWLADTGSGRHLCADMNDLIEYHLYEEGEERYAYQNANGCIEYADGYGKAQIDLTLDQGQLNVIFIDAYYAPKSPYSLFGCIRAKYELGLYYNAKRNILEDECGNTKARLYEWNYAAFLVTVHDTHMMATPKIPTPNMAATNIEAIRIHRRLAHCGTDRFINTVSKTDVLQPSGHVIGSPYKISCEACHVAKAKRLVSRETPERSTDILDLFHADIQPIKPQGFGGVNYYLIIVNDKHRVIFLKFLREKGDASQDLIRFCEWVHHRTGDYTKRWRLDGGKEFRKFINWGTSKTVDFEITAPRTAEQNGVAERYAGYINQTARAMILDAGLPKELWPLATETAVYTINRMLAPGESKSPMRNWREEFRLPNAVTTLRHVRIWGSKAYKHIPKEDRQQSDKMGPRAMLGHLVGYEGENGHLYKIWDPTENRIFRSRDVRIDEGDDMHPLPPPPPKPQNPTGGGGANTMVGRSVDIPIRRFEFIQVNPQIEQSSADTRTPDERITGRVQTISSDPMLTERPENHPSQEPERTILPSIEESTQRKEPLPESSIASRPSNVTHRSSPRTTKGKPPSRYIDEQEAHVKATLPGQFLALPTDQGRLYAHQVKVPSSYKAAIKSPQADAWNHAMEDQITKLTNPNRPTWKLVRWSDYPDANVLPGKWVYAVKTDQDNAITEFRARWVVCGNRQIHGVDFDATYTPVATDTTIKLVLSIISMLNLQCEQIDFVTAYLNAKLRDKKIFMRQPTGFAIDNSVCLLQQALYGLKQAGLLWNQDLDALLKEIGFTPLPDDPCVYIRSDDATGFCIIYVDDALIAARDQPTVEAIKRQLAAVYGIKDLGSPSKFLGCHIQRRNGTIQLNQHAYVKAILMETGMTGSKPVGIPMKSTYRLTDSKDSDILDEEQKGEYLSMMGKLNWLSTKTRPDITYALSRLQRKTATPSKSDYKAAQDVLRYLRHNPYNIVLGADRTQTKLAVYCDAAHQDHPDGKSTEAYVIKFGGAPILWGSKKQSLVAPSSTMAELIALDRAVKEALWVKKLLLQLRWPLDPADPIDIYTDSANAIKLTTKQGGYSTTTKWLDNRYFFVRDMVQRNEVKLIHINGDGNPADGLTKPLERIKFTEFRHLLGIHEDHETSEASTTEEAEEYGYYYYF